MEFSVETSPGLVGQGLPYKDIKCNIKCIESIFKLINSYALCILAFQFKWSLVLEMDRAILKEEIKPSLPAEFS